MTRVGRWPVVTLRCLGLRPAIAGAIGLLLGGRHGGRQQRGSDQGTEDFVHEHSCQYGLVLPDALDQ